MVGGSKRGIGAAARAFISALLSGSVWTGLASPGAATPAARPAIVPPVVHKVSVFGADQRVPLPQSMRPASRKLGVLSDARSHSICTAFCLAPDIIGTASHCLYRTNGERPLRLTEFGFRLNGETKSVKIAGATSGAPEANIISGSTRLNVRPPIDATRDWALVRLDEPACKSGAFTLSDRRVEEVMELAEKGRVFNVAYHRDLPKWQPMISTGCEVRRNFTDADWPTIRRDFADPGNLLLHTCDTGAASSGSPLLVDGPHGPEVVGINVGTYVQSKVIMLNGEVLHRFKSDDVANTGVVSNAFASSFAAFLDADTLVSRADVRRLQDELIGHGYYQGPRDGSYGPQLRDATERFERAAAMPVTGLATHTVLHALTSESAIVTGEIARRERSKTRR
jgi:protease YdgD